MQKQWQKGRCPQPAYRFYSESEREAPDPLEASLASELIAEAKAIQTAIGCL